MEVFVDMFAPLLKKLFGSKNEREVKRMLKAVQSVNALEEQMLSLSDEQLRSKTEEFKARLEKGETLDQILPEAFAVCREAGKRVMGMRHFDVQLIGGMTLHEGRIAEMRTGEGKTLVATLAVYLNALAGKGVHVVTVNDYLARRDANWMRPLYEFLGLSVGIVTPFQPPEEKRAAYAADITYGTNNEFGFDYLRDNMAFSLQEKNQRELNFAVIDEVDSILIDEARTPLIISGQAEDSSKLYQQINLLIPRLTQHIEEEEGVVTQEGHFSIDEKTRQVELNEQGHQYIEELLTQAGLLAEGESLYSAHNLDVLEGQPARAIIALREQIEQNLLAQRLGLACECRFSLAEALQVDGQVAEAELELRLALSEAARQHLVKPLYELQYRQPQWLARVLPAAKGESLRQRLLSYEREPEVTLPAADETVLSNRELTVLRLIAQGCSNQEIAEQLFISLHTVKTHARRINTKLGVARRTQAVAKAKALAWL